MKIQMDRGLRRLGQVVLAVGVSWMSAPAYAAQPQPPVLTEGVDPNCLTATAGGGLSVALNTGTLQAGSKIYEASFSAGTRTGRVRAYALVTECDPDEEGNCDPPLGSLIEPAVWDTLIFPAERTIFTFDPDIGGPDIGGGVAVPFTWAGLTAEHILGSAPWYVGPPERFFPDDLEAAAYSAFREANADRVPMVYFGANDGMLHGVCAADSGCGDVPVWGEVLAYVPAPVFPVLKALADPEYGSSAPHTLGPVSESDVYEGAWKTVLAGALGGGGQGIYLLDITAPMSFEAADVLWEFSDADDADLGFTYGEPRLIKRPDGLRPWAVAFGSGYNSTSSAGPGEIPVDCGDEDPATECADTTTVGANGNAIVYVANVSAGVKGRPSSVHKYDTGVGSAADPLGHGRANGIAHVAPVDKDGDFDTDYLYGGDLFGNVWRVDLSADPGAGNPAKIFTAVRDGVAQPITAPLRVVRHPTGQGFLVLFGTGKYLEPDNPITGGDVSNKDVQTFYAIWDDPDGWSAAVLGNLTRANLLEQEILVEQDHAGDFSRSRVTSNHAIRWALDPAALSDQVDEHLGWYMDLCLAPCGKAAQHGERVVQPALIRGDRVIFTTLIPKDDPCGSSWLMEVELADGSRLDRISPFDFNDDGVFNLEDTIALDLDGDGEKAVYYGSGIQIPNTGIYSAPVALVIPGQAEKKFVSTSTGEIIDINESDDLNRIRPWREIR